MIRKASKVLVLTILVLLLASGCNIFRAKETPVVEEPTGEEDPFIGVPNPASFYCQEMGYMLELRDSSGGTEGICIFPDGTECEEWEFLSGSCAIQWTYCQRQGSNIKAEDNIGTCVFSDGTSCPEYDYFIGECEPPQ